MNIRGESQNKTGEPMLYMLTLAWLQASSNYITTLVSHLKTQHKSC